MTRWLFASLLLVAGCERTPAPPAVVPPPPPAPSSPAATPSPPSPSPAATPVATPAQTPQPTATAAPTLSGTFAGDRLRLTLTGTGATRTGSLAIRKRKLPLTARRIGDRLEGTLTIEGTEQRFTLRAEGDDVVELTADGRTYRLVRPSAVEPWSGRFHSDDRGSRLILSRSGASLKGRVEAAGVRYALTGTVEAGAARGSLRDPQTGQDHAFRATRARDRLTFVLQTSQGERTSLRTLIFQRD